MNNIPRAEYKSGSDDECVRVVKINILVLIWFGFDLNVISRAQFSVAFYPLMKRQQPRNVWNLQHLFAQQWIFINFPYRKNFAQHSFLLVLTFVTVYTVILTSSMPQLHDFEKNVYRLLNRRVSIYQDHVCKKGLVLADKTFRKTRFSSPIDFLSKTWSHTQRISCEFSRI